MYVYIYIASYPMFESGIKNRFVNNQMQLVQRDKQ